MQVPGTKTTILFLVEENNIFLATSGYSGRNWPRVLKRKKHLIEQQINWLKTNKT